MSKSKSSNRKRSNIRKHSNARKNSKSMRKQNRRSRSVSNKHSNSSALTRRNWMKKLLFKGGDASHHTENVFGGIGQHHAMSANNNAIHQNPPMVHAPGPAQAQGGAQLDLAM